MVPPNARITISSRQGGGLSVTRDVVLSFPTGPPQVTPAGGIVAALIHDTPDALGLYKVASIVTLVTVDLTQDVTLTPPVLPSVTQYAVGNEEPLSTSRGVRAVRVLLTAVAGRS